MRKSLQIAAAAVVFPLLALASQAKAAVLVLPGPIYSANLTWNNNGTVSLNTAPTVDYTGVLQNDELFTHFCPQYNSSSGLQYQPELRPCGRLGILHNFVLERLWIDWGHLHVGF